MSSERSGAGRVDRGRNLRLALILASIALAIFAGFLLRNWLLR